MPVFRAPEKPILGVDNEMISQGAIDYWENEVSSLESDADALNEFYRQFPRTEEHAFRDETKNSLFNLVKIYEQIDYNEGVKLKGVGDLVPKLNATPLDKQVVLINPNAFVNFNIEIIASLFNSNKLLGENFTWKVIPFTNKTGAPILTGTYAMILDKGRFVLSTKMNIISSIYNPMGPSQITHLNRKMFYGHIGYFNAVKLTNAV